MGREARGKGPGPNGVRAAAMVWLPWKSKKKALETTEKSRETQESSTPKKATPAREDAAASKPAAAPGGAGSGVRAMRPGLRP